MTLNVTGIVSRAFAIAWRHRWLWLLGAFAGSGFGFQGNFSGSSPGRGSGTPDVFSTFVSQHLAEIVVLGVILLVIIVASAVIGCISVPGAIWAALQLDVGAEVGLGMAWREGRRRGWRYFRLAAIKFLIVLCLVVPALLIGLLGALLFSAGGEASVPLLILGGVLLFIALVVGLIFLGFALTWSDRVLVLLDVSAWDSVRAGWWLFKHNKLNTFVFGLAVGLVRFCVSILVTLGAVVVAAPGIGMLVVYFTSPAPATALVVAGAAWVILLGGAVLLVGSGFSGAVLQVAYALAARDLCVRAGLDVLPEVIGWDPRAAAGPAPSAQS